MLDCESMSSQMMSKLPPIAENDKLEKEVRINPNLFPLMNEKIPSLT